MGPARFPVLADLVLVDGRGLRAQRSLVAEPQLGLLLAMPVHEEPPQVSAPPADRIQQTMIMKERREGVGEAHLMWRNWGRGVGARPCTKDLSPYARSEGGFTVTL